MPSSTHISFSTGSIPRRCALLYPQICLNFSLFNVLSLHTKKRKSKCELAPGSTGLDALQLSLSVVMILTFLPLCVIFLKSAIVRTFEDKDPTFFLEAIGMPAGPLSNRVHLSTLFNYTLRSLFFR